jgi:hypothetical protein
MASVLDLTFVPFVPFVPFVVNTDTISGASSRVLAPR